MTDIPRPEFWRRDEAQRAVHYWESVDLPHRRILVDAVRTFGQVGSILEVGCSSGPNLWRLKEAFPEATLIGLEISAGAVDFGSEQFAEADRAGRLPGEGQVNLCVGQLPDDLAAMPAVDVVLSCYTLAYLSPEQLEVALPQMVARAQKGLVIAEPMVEPGRPRGVVHAVPEWRHDYVSWFRDHCPAWLVGMKPMNVERMNLMLTARRP